MNRRHMLKSSAISLGGVAGVIHAATPGQPEGPFHPVNIDHDLRRKSSNSPYATGQQIIVTGSVIDSKTGRGISQAMIEIWQADHQGKYNHPSDPLDLEPDPDFQFWGRASSDLQGRYQFLSIKPGSYPASPGWYRPPHIHIHVSRRGYHPLTTQMYFDGETLNDSDRILAQLSPVDRKKLIVSFAERSNGLQAGQFNIELDPVN